MRRLIYLEWKRIITTRTTWVLLAVIILLSAVMAYFPISFVKTEEIDEEGNLHLLEGKAAIECLKQKEAGINGEITEEEFCQAITVFQECYREYGAIFPPEMPREEYVRRIEPVLPVLNLAAAVLTPEGVGLYTMTDADLALKDASRFYEQYRERLAWQGKTDAEQEKIREMSKDIKMPFTYISGYEISSFEYLTLYALLMMMAFVVIISPVFLAEYQTGADSILRCTKFGRLNLAAAKIVTSLMVFAVTFFIGMGVFLGITDLVFGVEGLKASIQTVWGVFEIPAFTAGQTQAAVAAGQFLSILAMVSFTLFVSARCKNVQDSLKIAILVGLLPIIISVMSSSNPAKLVRCILPSGGIGFTDSFLFDLLGTQFVHLGPAVIWTPYLVLGAALVEIPLFLFLAVRSYCRRESV